MRTTEHPLNNPFAKGYFDNDNLDWPITEGKVTCDTLNLSTPIKVFLFKLNDKKELAESVGRFIAFHAAFVHPRLNGFAGYDTLQYEFIKI